MREFENYKVLAIENVNGGTLADVIKRRNAEARPLTDAECA